ncbi:hypothetical protein [Krasilnikoviella flava]|uniref:hypothetical protein n=1 Tax=Krasilnikoviella flava TaxID=526729 RepID=UPI0009A6177C|nr:hypothetical protein [Krasilnikoviella flava]
MASGAFLLPVAPAAAGAVPSAGGDPDGGVALSVDGRRWSDDLEVALFEASPWVPGETRSSVLLVRNDRRGTASGQVAVALGAGAGDAAGALARALRVRVRPGGDPWTAAGRPVPVRLAESEVLPVALEVTLAASAGDDTQGATVPLDVVVTLVGEQPAAGERPRDEPAPGDGARAAVLPRTGGSPAVPLLVAAGAVLLGALLRWAVAAREGRRG